MWLLKIAQIIQKIFWKILGKVLLLKIQKIIWNYRKLSKAPKRSPHISPKRYSKRSSKRFSKSCPKRSSKWCPKRLSKRYSKRYSKISPERFLETILPKILLKSFKRYSDRSSKMFCWRSFKRTCIRFSRWSSKVHEPSSIYSCSIGHIWEHDFCHLGCWAVKEKFLKRRNFC